jgi:hypothetical protein
MLAILGWRPDADHRKRVELPSETAVVTMAGSAQPAH